MDHSYGDKYSLSEFVTNSALAASVNALDRLGLDGAKLRMLHRAASYERKSVTLRFSSTETCSFVSEGTVEIGGSQGTTTTTEYETYETTGSGETYDSKTRSTKSSVHKTVIEYRWNFAFRYSVVAFVGNDPNVVDDEDEDGGNASASAVLRNGTSPDFPLVVRGDAKRPQPETTTVPDFDVDLTWFLRQLDLGEDGSDDNDSEEGGGGGGGSGSGSGSPATICGFSIDRDRDSCRTPRRNRDMDGAEAFFSDFRRWNGRIVSYLTSNVWNRVARFRDPEARTGSSSYVVGDRGGGGSALVRRLKILNGEIFVPVLPLLGEGSEANEDSEVDVSDGDGEGVVGEGGFAGRLLPIGDLDLLLEEQCRSMDGKLRDLSDAFPKDRDGDDVISAPEASLALLVMHAASVSEAFFDGVNFVEERLRSQLVSAVGKELRPSDLDEFLRSHYRRMFREEYVPRPFVYAVRRPRHYPDGTISIETAAEGGGGDGEPIVTISRKVGGDGDDGPMLLPLNAATTVEFSGDRYLHAWVRHVFNAGGSRLGPFPSDATLVARARQFSSFMVVIGTVSGRDTLTPIDAIIVQNRDEVLLPLLLDPLPTPGEFRDAIGSLSPEQRRFAEAFRNVQLESSVMGVLVVQLRPQLEAVLNLPRDSLTKEIRLTQDLLSLFVEHQIPPDLLTYDDGEGGGDSDGVSVGDKVSEVKGHVASLHGMILDAKEKELEEARRRADLRAETETETRRKSAPREDVTADNYPTSTSMPQQGERRLMHTMHTGPEQNQQQQQQQAAPILMRSALSSDESAPAGSDASGLRARGPRERRAPEAATPTSETPHSEGMPSGAAFDFTQIPRLLDSRFEELDDGNALRPTKVRIGETWTRRRHDGLLAAERETATLGIEERRVERDRSFDLLDALTKSGALPLAHTDLHVLVAATHGFDKSLIDTIVQDNVNPIERMERSLLIVSSAVQGLPAGEIVSRDRATQVASHSPKLLIPVKDAGLSNDDTEVGSVADVKSQ